jgi:hypothetical protein
MASMRAGEMGFSTAEVGDLVVEGSSRETVARMRQGATT